MGSDLDMRVLKGWSVGRKTYNQEVNDKLKTNPASESNEDYDVFTNFDYYELPRPEIFTQNVL